MNWISMKKPPEDDEQLCAFIWWSENGGVITSDIYKWKDAKIGRKFEIENQYTHWMPLPEPKPKPHRA